MNIHIPLFGTAYKAPLALVALIFCSE